MSKQLIVLAVLVGGVVAVACGQTPALTFQNNIDPATETSFGTLPPPDYDGGIGGLPCDVATVVRTRCASCHRNPPTGNATMPLTTWAELTAASPSGASYAARSLLRMKDTTSPMPPGAPLPASEIAAFEAWVNGGAKMGTCSADAGVPMVTCTANQSWATANRYLENPEMNPGLACRSCHDGQNFKGQNPSLRSKRSLLFTFAGTIYPGQNQKDFCFSYVPAGTTVEIIDRTGQVQLTLTPLRVSGNFFSDRLTTTPVWLPYTVKVKRNGAVVSEMTTPQMNGDCNVCHTELGEQGAPGRITY
ncbi:MAG: hypothetical protein GQE15_13745 [Archangiaceae bacterium]|nr:hypothetical protein [Archangiaceae bacterium]